MSNNELVVEWTLPRPPLLRFCNLKFTCSSWPDNGKGVWQVIGYHDLDLKSEYFDLLRVMPSECGGSTGEIIKVGRSVHDSGGLMIWTNDLFDPVYCKQ